MLGHTNILVATGLHRGRKTRSDREDDAQIRGYLNWNNYNPNDTLRRFDVVDDQISFLRESDVTNYGVGDDMKRAQVQEHHINALLDKANEKIEKEENYGKLLWVSCFAILYVIMLVVQGNIVSDYAVESSVHTTIINQLTSGNGLEYGTSLFADMGSIPSSSQFYSWLSTSILNRILTQPECGDGICEPPTEYPGFGRFGCIPDCGTYSKTTTLTIDIESFLHFSKNDVKPWDLSNVTLTDDPRFTYNIFSSTMQDFLFENDMSPNDLTLLEAPDGNLTLYLYQTGEMSTAVDPQEIYSHLGVLATTLPARSATTDFAYGDPREFISTSTVILDAISNYCNTALNADANCVTYSQQEVMIRILGSYGLSGTITASNGGRGRDYYVSLPFCSVVPNRTEGTSDSANKAFFVSSSAPCPLRRRRSSQYCDGLSCNLTTSFRDAKVEFAEDLVFTARSGRRDLIDPQCNSWSTVTGMPDCTSPIDEGCPTYWTEVCVQNFPPYFLLPTSCKAHSDCATAFSAPFCSSSGFCEPCYFCQVAHDDSIDSVCPQKVCPGSGGWPRCVNGVELVRSLTDRTCPSTFNFGIWKFHDTNENVDVQPSSTDKTRWVTPFNLLVGPVIVTQRRDVSVQCTSQEKSSVQNFFQGYLCRSGVLDGTPYGVDPAFLPSSSIYNGKLKMSDYYNVSEVIPSSTSNIAGVNVTTRPTAIGFFPQQYQRMPDRIQDEDLNLFRLYFDGRLTTSQANSMITYMMDGNFIDDNTESVEVEFVTFNPSMSKFSRVTFVFDWQAGGKIIWDFSISTFSVDLYVGQPGRIQFGLEVLCILFLCFSTFFKLGDLFQSIKSYTLQDYLLDPQHWFHWIHTCLMWYGWFLWLTYYRSGQNFEMDPSYPVLADTQAKARMFKTDPVGEQKYLDLVRRLEDLSSLAQNYRAIAGLCAFLFVFSLLEAFRFQPRLGLISTTLSIVAPDLFNFVILFATIFGGFSVAATLSFGHQVFKVSTVDKSVVFLFFLMISLDPTQFWAEFSHAAPEWAFELWAWSFTFIMGFGLFQVFLALLIEGLNRADDEKGEAPNVAEDVTGIVQERINGMSKSYMSDRDFRSHLLARKAGLPNSKQLRDMILMNMQGQDEDDDVEIPLPGGLTFGAKDFEKILDQRLTDSMTNSTSTEYAIVPRPSQDSQPRFTIASEDEVIASELKTRNKRQIIQDIITRVSNESEASDVDDNSVLIQILNLEHLFRNLVLFKGHGVLMDYISTIGRTLVPMAKKMLTAAEYFNFAKTLANDRRSENIVSGKLEITVVDAENLPRMDMIESIDAYCVLFLAPVAIQRIGLKCNAMRTKAVPNTCSPQWMERFTLDVEHGDEFFIVTVFDSDSVTTDDLVGCVVIPFRDLRGGEAIDNWFDIELAKSVVWNTKRPKIHLQLQFFENRAQASLWDGVEEWAAT